MENDMQNQIKAFEKAVYEFPQKYMEQIASYENCKDFIHNKWIEVYKDCLEYPNENAISLIEHETQKYITNLLWKEIDPSTNDVTLAKFLNHIDFTKIMHAHLSKASGYLANKYPINEKEYTDEELNEYYIDLLKDE
jgi:hypothetical protein